MKPPSEPLPLIDAFRTFDFQNTGQTIDIRLLEHFLQSVEEKFSDDEIDQFRKLPPVEGTKFNYQTYIDLVQEKRIDCDLQTQSGSPATKQLVVKKPSVPIGRTKLNHPPHTPTSTTPDKVSASPEIIITHHSPGMIQFGGNEANGVPIRRVTTELAIMPRQIRKDILSGFPNGPEDGSARGTLVKQDSRSNNEEKSTNKQRVAPLPTKRRMNITASSSVTTGTSGNDLEVPKSIDNSKFDKDKTGETLKEGESTAKKSTFFSLGSFRMSFGGSSK